ncbi:MAG: hypothetical protein OHK93_004789 [Ramalina farinacea]|uniref:Uncharacterized protein n=1 Tax=Ramalina farinacea TaxID=258253 RepID=A0AA43U0M6_9LECA|nr:hypothetical protein [Ramalina farinacea]
MLGPQIVTLILLPLAFAAPTPPSATASHLPATSASIDPSTAVNCTQPFIDDTRLANTTHHRGGGLHHAHHHLHQQGHHNCSGSHHRHLNATEAALQRSDEHKIAADEFHAKKQNLTAKGGEDGTEAAVTVARREILTNATSPADASWMNRTADALIVGLAGKLGSN